jgi:hypothetical protein
MRQQGEVLEHHAHRWRRISIISRGLAAAGRGRRRGSRPPVGSIRRDMQRTSVDLPEPDRPMMTKISPSRPRGRRRARRRSGRRRDRSFAGPPPRGGEKPRALRAEQLPDRRGRPAFVPFGHLRPRHAKDTPAADSIAVGWKGPAAQEAPGPVRQAYSIQAASGLVGGIQSATTSSSFLPSRSTSPTIAPISSLDVEAPIALWAPGHLSFTPAQATFQIGPRGLPQS